jgi:hypothetical protein
VTATIRAALVALALAGSLAGCKDEKKTAAAPTMAPSRARDAALQAIAALPGLPKTVQFRGVQSYSQALANHTAVCGLVSGFADDPTIFVAFVSVATQVNPADAATPRFTFDSHVGTTTTEAGRVYLALVADCWDRGGPAAERPLSLPPLPDNIPDPHLPPAPDPIAAVPAPKLPAVVPGQVAAGGTVTVRQSANVHSGPGGPSTRTVQQGQVLHVFATSTGGWYQVGDTAPFGWVHESMLNH